MSYNEKDKAEQIPSSQNSGETASVVSEQGGIPGQRKEVNVENYEKLHR